MRRQSLIVVLNASAVTLGGGLADWAEEHMVFCQPNNTFQPSELTIEEGDTGLWFSNTPSGGVPATQST